MQEIDEQIDEAARTIQRDWNRWPRVGVVLGTGLGGFAEHIDVEFEIDYASLPRFPRSTAAGHRGRLVCGHVDGVPLVTMEGRFHYYEGYRPEQVTRPILLMKKLGVGRLIISNASGGLNPLFASGDIMAIEDHINLTARRMLVAKHDGQLGTIRSDASATYDSQLIERAVAVARQNEFTCHRGVYVAVLGPNYETRAEYRYMRAIGGDVVGMSTVPEAIFAARIGMRVLALSVVTNVCRPNLLEPTSSQEVIAAAVSAEPKMRQIVLGIIGDLQRTDAHGRSHHATVS